MMRRWIAWALLASLQSAAPACAEPHAAVLTDTDQAWLVRAQVYLDGLRTLKARFLQIAPDGQTSQGDAWLQRPGRMRIQYDPPSPLLLVAGHGTVVFRDAKLDQTTNIPMAQTPLGLLLRDRVVLTGDVTTTDFQRHPSQVEVTLVRTSSPGDGSLTLYMNADPLALVGWSVVDAQGRETRIRLSGVTLGGLFDQNLFNFVDPNGFNTPER